MEDFIKINKIYFIFIEKNLIDKTLKIVLNSILIEIEKIYIFEKNLLVQKINCIKKKINKNKCLGRPKGSQNITLKLDKHKDEIQNYLNLGLNKTSIALLLKVNVKTIKTFIEKRDLKI